VKEPLDLYQLSDCPFRASCQVKNKKETDSDRSRDRPLCVRMSGIARNTDKRTSTGQRQTDSPTRG